MDAEKWINRTAYTFVRELFSQFPCVAILGPRQCGKSTLLEQLFPNTKRFDCERKTDFERISKDSDFFLSSQPHPIIIDEAQKAPDLFEALRVHIDENRGNPGQIMLSGSSSPLLLNQLSDSLAGRLALFELSPFSWSESSQKPLSPFYQNIIQSRFEDNLTLTSLFSFEELCHMCISGGYPEIVQKSETHTYFRERWFENYQKTYVETDIRDLFPNLKTDSFKRFITILAALSGQFINFSHIARSLDVSQPTVKKYFACVSGTFLWRHLLQYEKNPLKSLARMPKGYIRDSGLLCSFLNIFSQETLLAHPEFGFIWESFITEQILKSLQFLHIPFKAWSYRTQNQGEIDLILEGRWGLIPIEIKSGSSVRHQSTQTIRHFMEENRCPVGYVISNGPDVYSLGPNLVHIPAGCL
jgi:predicted AAA+ superfamily ATPase